MAKKKKSANIPSIIITAIAVLLAAAAVIFLIYTVREREQQQQPQPVETTTTAPQIPQELVDEAQQAAYELLPKNYKVYQYLTMGMSHEEEPYGNLPEDGYYTCVNSDFASFEEFSDYVKSIFTEKAADKLLTDPFGFGPVYGVDDKGGLGLSQDYEKAEQSGLSWADVQFVCTVENEVKCSIEITLKDADDKDVKKEVDMILENGEWRLTDMVG